MNGFISNPQTVEDFVSNARFQLTNVEGWVQMARDRNQDLQCARIKAQCLHEASAALLAKLEAECRTERRAA
jgi:hypothetical protein